MKQPPKNRTRIRLTIDVTPAVYETFSRIAEGTGMGIGRTMGDWLGDTLEAADFVAGQVERARRAPEKAAKALHSYASALSAVTEELLEKVEAGSPAGPAAASGRPAGVPGKDRSPPPGNTGGKPPARGASRG